MSFDAVKLAKGARRAAWQHTPERLRNWRDDIEQDIALALWRLQLSHQGGVNPKHYRWCALKAVRHLRYLLLRGLEVEPLDDDMATAAPAELGPIALWRLQAVWEDLTQLQQLALTALVSGESRRGVERANGLPYGALKSAGKRALLRIDNPRAFTKPASANQRYDLTTPRIPTDPAKIDAEKAAGRLASREHRRRLKGAA